MTDPKTLVFLTGPPAVGNFPFAPHLFLDSTDLSPLKAAERIAGHFALRRVKSVPSDG